MATQPLSSADRYPQSTSETNDRVTHLAFNAFMALLVVAFLVVVWLLLSL